MQLIIYEPVNADPKAFIEFWADRYTGYDDDFYTANAGKELAEARILDLFEWKNGTNLSGPKRNSVMRNFVARRHEFADRRDQTAPQLLEHFADGGVIWRIFWLHCWRTLPDLRPARHAVHTGGCKGHVPEKDPDKIRAYIEQYMPFHARFDGLPQRAVDKALWAFGKFIGENNFPTAPLR